MLKIGNAINSETTGGNNVAISQSALRFATSSSNVAVGAQSGSNISTGSNNVFLGVFVANNNGNSLTGGQNTAIGQSSSPVITGAANQNTAVGADTFNALTSGNNNTALGFNVANNITTGTQNLTLGTNGNCNPSTATTNNEIDICAGAGPVFKSTGGGTPSTSQTTIAGTLSVGGTQVGLSFPAGTATFAGGTGITSVACASGYSCNNTRGTLTIVGGTATTGTIATVTFSATLPTAPACFASMNGGATAFGIGNSAPTTTTFNITAGISVVGATFNVNYQCQP